MISPKARSGSGIREFLQYYFLAALKENPATKGKIIGNIEQESIDNQKYRTGSILHIAESDMEQTLRVLTARKLAKYDEKNGVFTLTDRGRKTLQKMNSEKEQVKNFKDDATAKLVSILSLDAGEKASEKYVLDVGTGEGYLAFKLAEAGFKVLGIDSSELDYARDSIKKATEKSQNNPGLDFRVADVKKLKMDETFDYVVSSQAIHCMKNQKECICSIYNLLKKGGLLAVSDFLIGLRGFFVHGFHSFLALSKEEWEQILTECGYVNIRVHEINDFCVVEARKPM